MAASLVGLVAIWAVLVETASVSVYLVPSPADVARALVDFREPIAKATFITFREVVFGFLLALVGGFVLAVALSYSRILNRILYPPMVLLHSMPKAAIAPILLIWFGFGMTHKVVLAMLVAFFPIVIAFNSGLRRIDPNLRDLAFSLRASWLKTFWKIDLPFALPSLFAGLRVATHLAVVGAVIAEFVAGDEGLAALLRNAGAQHETALSFGCAIALSVMSALLFALVALIEARVVPWAQRET